MAQYNRIKTKYPQAILLFRVGDFYETFGEDAITTAKVLGIVQTKRANGAASHIELAGFPHHALDTYLPKLVKAGYRVAICDQLEDPKKTKTIVKRGVTELITPGVAANDNILDNKSNNFLASVFFGKNEIGISFIDISTGEFLVAEGQKSYIEKLLQSFNPSEVIFSKNHKREFLQKFGSKFYTYAIDEWVFELDYTREKLLNHFETNSLKGFGVEKLNSGIIASGAALHYLNETEHNNLKHIFRISRIAEDNYVWLDRFSIRNLELIHGTQENAKTLQDVIDFTISPMGGRMMKKWILLPLKDLNALKERHLIVEHLIKEHDQAKTLRTQIKQIGDIERMISKVPLGKINPRELVQLKKSLISIKEVKENLAGSSTESLQKIADQLNLCPVLIEKLENTIHDEAPPVLSKGNVIKKGISGELDELRSIIHSGKEFILNIQKKESERTGISSLKVGFNNVFGYYLEVTNVHKSKVPEDWIRKQTLTNAERYITEELKIYEQKILGAEEKIAALEEKLFLEVVAFVADYIEPVQLNATLIARIDCLLSFAEVALKNNYVKPEVNDSLEIKITEGRHPVIEKQMEVGEEYIPNDIFLNNEEQQVIIITGPNMSGKSAVLRQTALIVLMAQIGSFVPAAKAKIGIVDKIFTRVGASDNISSGESTFMVEMNETASIVNNISERSLIILDEIGRGTSTYDGISIAWSLAEYLCNHPVARPKTLFATHYHELNELAEKYPLIKNFNVSTKEAGGKVLFLRKLVEGGSKHSFGIHVAKMAGMPKQLLDRANEMLSELEKKSLNKDISETVKSMPANNYQLSIFDAVDPKLNKLKEALDDLEVDSLTPIEALMKLNELKKML